MQCISDPGKHPVGFEETAVHAVTHRHDGLGPDRQVGIPRPFGQRDVSAQIADRRVALISKIALRNPGRDGITLLKTEGIAPQHEFERVKVHFVAEQELLPAVEQAVQAAKQRMYIRRFPGTDAGQEHGEKSDKKSKQFFHFRRQVCANIAIKSA